MKKICILGHTPPPYFGPSNATEVIRKSKLKTLYDLSIFSTNTNISLTELKKINLKKFLSNIRLFVSLIKLLNKNKFDLILIPISQTTVGFLRDSIFILISKFFSKKIIVQLRGGNWNNWLKESSFYTKSYVALIMKIPNGGIVLGDSLRYIFEPYFGKKFTFTVPNGFNLVNKGSKHKNSIFTLLFLANLQESKGLFQFLKSIKTLVDKAFIFQANIVGEWRCESFKKKCLSFIDENKLPVQIFCNVHGENKYKYFLESDIFVFTPIEQEGHPWVIIEALACGLPIISSDKGVIAEYVLDSENGYIINPNDINKIVVKIEKLYENNALIKKMGLRSKHIYDTLLKEENLVNNYKKCFDFVISNEI